jgi:hypothetical protein
LSAADEVTQSEKEVTIVSKLRIDTLTTQAGVELPVYLDGEGNILIAYGNPDGPIAFITLGYEAQENLRPILGNGKAPASAP